MKKRTVQIMRKTKETAIRLSWNLDGKGSYKIRTGIPFLDHMLELFSKHSGFDIALDARGDLAVDDHHTVEDIGLCFGKALNQALGKREGIARFGHAFVPMDEALAFCAVDLGGRPYLVYRVEAPSTKIKTFDTVLIEHFLEAFVNQGRFNLHAELRYGKNPHHIFEGVFKAMARALRMAVHREEGQRGVPSTKGSLG